MFSSLRQARGETMIEVLVAVLVIIVGAMASLSTLDYLIARRQVARELVIATNLSREGLEAVRTIRDTNWLRYAGERRKCWNNADPAGDPTCGGLIADGGHYRADLDLTNYRFSLTPVSGALNLRSGATGTPSYLLKRDNATGVYTHTPPASSSTTDTIYYRQIMTEYVGDDGNSVAPTTRAGMTCSGVADCANVLRVTSKVEWMDRGEVYDVVLTTLFTDYLGRKDHN